MNRHLLLVQIKKYSMLKSSSCAQRLACRIAGVLFELAVEIRLADAQQECAGALITSDFPQGVHEGNAARERSAWCSIFYNFLFAPYSLEQKCRFNTAECVVELTTESS
jgi:hypothetical protein